MIKKITLLIFLVCAFTFSSLYAQITVTCGTPTNTTNCYTNSTTQTWVFESSDGTSPLKAIFNAGETENNWDELIVYDSDGVTELYNGYGASGDLTGLEFTSSGTSITVQVTPDGSGDCPGNGYTPWDWDVVCLACNAPSSSGQTVVDDCPNSQFTVDVVIDGLGDGTSFVTDGTSMWAATALGTVTAGPFANGTPVTLTLAHGTDNTCDVALGTFSESGLCPTIVTCGTPTNTTNCYTNSTTQTWVFESSDGTSPLKATFNAGETENGWDELIVYDSDGTTVLYNGYGAAGDLTGLEFTASGTSITIQVTPDGSGDCPGNGYTPWDWDVVCLACNAPSSSGQTVVDDCPNSQFIVDVVIDGLGDGTSFVTDGTSMWAATALGTVTAGPFANGTPVTLTLAHGTDNTCDVALGTFSESGLCPTIVTCGTATNTTNCYTSSVIQTWVFESSDGTSPLKVIFNAGETENNWDELIVYDSDGVTELYNGYGASGDLTGLEFTSSGTSITVQVTPDGGVDCVSNGYTPWDWDVVCLACNAPSSSGQTVVDDCPNSQFTVDVVIDGLGDGTSFVTDGTSMWAATALGTVTAGPFANGTPVTLTLAHGTDNTCDVALGTFSESGLCPTIVTCGTPVNTTNCYTNSTTQTWVFESSDGTSPLQVTFNAGETENNWDELIVYDSDGVTELYNGYGASGDLTGLTFISSGTSITVEVTPDGSGDCPGNGYIPWDWDVDCFACGTSAIGLPPMGTLASLTATISCDDSNWTYYENPSVAGEYLFAIEWDPGLAGDNTAAKAAASVTIDILAAMIEPAGNNATEASYGMARYWNVDLGGATLDSPVNVKFYYDPAEALATTTASAAHASGQDNGFSWFKTNGTTFTPADITATPFQSSVLILTPAGAGTDNGITYVQFDGITSFSGGTGAAGAGAGFLPIELASFSGQAMDNYNMLEWVTASEENTRMHVIERSLNGVADFREIGSVAAAGNSQTDIRYSLNDENPGALGYYRLKTIDLDGSVQYSDVISIQRKGDIFELVNTYPVPTTKDLTIEFVITEDEEVTYTLTDITGKVVMYNTIEATKGLNKQVIDIATISNGVYFLTLQNSTSRIIKNIVKN